MTNNSENTQATAALYTNDKALYITNLEKFPLVVFEYVYIKIDPDFDILDYWIYSEYL